jgi:hypothetical protein
VCVCVQVCVCVHTHTHTNRSVVQRLDMNNFGPSTEMEGYEEGACADSYVLRSSPHTNPGIFLSLSLSLSLYIRPLTSVRGHILGTKYIAHHVRMR